MFEDFQQGANFSAKPLDVVEKKEEDTDTDTDDTGTDNPDPTKPDPAQPGPAPPGRLPPGYARPVAPQPGPLKAPELPKHPGPDEAPARPPADHEAPARPPADLGHAEPPGQPEPADRAPSKQTLTSAIKAKPPALPASLTASAPKTVKPRVVPKPIEAEAMPTTPKVIQAKAMPHSNAAEAYEHEPRPLMCFTVYTDSEDDMEYVWEEAEKPRKAKKEIGPYHRKKRSAVVRARSYFKQLRVGRPKQLAKPVTPVINVEELTDAETGAEAETAQMQVTAERRLRRSLSFDSVTFFVFPPYTNWEESH